MHESYLEAGYDRPLLCSSCFPGVHEYNKAAYIIYTECSDQYIMGMSGAICLNILAINSVMDDHEVQGGADRLDIRRDVKKLSSMVLEMQRVKNKDKK